MNEVQYGQSSPYPDNISELASPITARYFRVDVTAVTEKDSAHTIREFEIWGVDMEQDDGEEETDSLTNLSLLSTATMDQESYTGNGNHPVELAIDSDPATYAQSMYDVATTGTSWNLTVDLQGKQEIHQFRVLTGNANRATAYELQISDDAQSWETVATVTDAKEGGSSPNWFYNETVLEAPVQAAYVRLYVTDSVDQMGSGHSLRDFQILGKILDYGELDGCDESQLGTAVASDISVTSVSSNSVNKDYAADGSADTSWKPASSDTGPYIIVDTAKAHDITGVQIQYTGEAAAKYVVYTSEDNIRWYEEAELTLVGTTHNFQYNQVNRRYIRLDMFFMNGTKGISEVKVYGKETALAEVPTVTETFGDSSTYERMIIAPTASDVAGAAVNSISLNGEWDFCLYPELGYWEADSAREDWSSVTLPGDAETQGYIRYYLAVNSATEFESAFERTVTIPEDFEGERVILRLNGVMNYGRLFVDGQLVRTHRGGKTTWDTDITDYVTPGKEARITVGVTCEIPKVDFQRIRGITGDITLMAVPENYISTFHAVTDLDETYTNATLTVEAGVLFNEGTSGEIKLSLTDPNGNAVALENDTITVNAAETSVVEQTVENTVTNVTLWDSEHPNLYTLTAELYQNGVKTETVTKRIGFREIEIDGNTLYVNGDKIKLRGADYSDHKPDQGVASDEAYQKEILEKLKAANINFIRTAHCPQSAYFYSLCDEMGFYVESEASIVFIDANNESMGIKDDPNYTDAYLNAVAEMIEEHKSHPSILYWSLANESTWGTNNVLTYEYAKMADPTRPTKFSWGYNIPPEYADISSSHYYTSVSNTDVPIVMDEYAHGLTGYDEMRFDPGYEAYYSETIVSQWEDVYNNDQYLGGAIWHATDKAFYMEDGTVNTRFTELWGLMDGWGREKTQYWHVKKAYSPFKIQNETTPLVNPGVGNVLNIEVENRFNHSNLNECTIAWSVGSDSGTITDLDVAMHTKGTMTIPARNWQDGEVLNLTITYQGAVVDEYALSIGEKVAPDLNVEAVETPVTVTEDTHTILLTGENFTVSFSKYTGLILSGSYDGTEVLCGGPYLNLGIKALSGWSMTDITARESANGNALVAISGTYGDVTAKFDLTVDSTGRIETSFTASNIPSGYTEIGVAYITSAEGDNLTWLKNGEWTVYPETNIDRLSGTAAKYNTISDTMVGGVEPTWEWYQDTKSFFLFGDNDEGGRGTNDFRSKKTDYYFVSLNFPNDTVLRAEGDGEGGSVRAAIESDGKIRFNINDVWGVGGNNFGSSGTSITLGSGNSYSGTVAMRLMSVKAPCNCVDEDKNKECDICGEEIFSIEEINKVIELINTIGTVTSESEEAITAARTAYDNLTEKERLAVTNYDALEKAEYDYALLTILSDAEIAQAAAEDAQKAAEEAQKAAEKARDEAVAAQTTAETAKADAEAANQAAEDAQAKAEAAQAAAEEANSSAGKNAEAAKSAQTAAEKAQELAEAAAEKAKQAEDNALTAQTKAEEAEKNAEAAEANAETAQAKAEEAAQAAEESNAEAAQEAAKAAEEAASAAAEAAKAAAESAKAAQSASDASASAAAAAKSAEESAGYANDAAQSAKDAQIAQKAAEDAQAAAEEAEKAAEEERLAAEEAQKAAEEAQAAAEAAQKASEKAALDGAKYQAALNIDTYAQQVDQTGYDRAQTEALAEIVSNAKAAIADAETIDDVQEILDEAKAEIAAIEDMCPSKKYTDVAVDTWYHESVDYMVENSYMNGVSDTLFDINGSVTRAQLVTILYRVAGEPSVEGLENPFTDVANGKWYTNAVIWAADEGIVKGVTETEFAPDNKITREQIVTILYRYDGELAADEDVLDGYSDAASVSAYAVDAMNWAIANGIVNGVTETTLAPADTATRTQICAIMMRYLEN